MKTQKQVSYRFSVTKQDIILWAKNATIFLIPVVIVFLTELVKVVPQGWQYAALATWAISQAIAFLKYWAQYRTY